MPEHITDREALDRFRTFVDGVDVPMPTDVPGSGVVDDDSVDDGFEDGGRHDGTTTSPTRTRHDEVGERHLSRRALLGGAAAAASLVGITAVAGAPVRLPALPAGSPDDGGGDGEDRGHPIPLPTTLPGYWPLRPTLEVLPTGRVSMVYVQSEAQHLPGEPLRAVTLDAHLGRTRALATANDRENYESPAPAIVSDDGTRLAVGSISWQGEVVLLGADGSRPRTVRVTDRPQRDVTPLAFSPDGSVVLVRDQDANITAHWGEPQYGRVAQVDVATGTCVDAGLGEQVVDVSFSPDGSRLVVLGVDGGLDVVDRATGRRTRVASTRAPRPGDDRPSAAHAWSPDGRRIVALDRSRAADGPVMLHVHDMADGVATGTRRSWSLPSASWRGLAWTGPTTYLAQSTSSDDGGRGRLHEIDVRTGRVSLVSRWSAWPVSARVRDVSVAADLVRQWRVTRLDDTF